MVFDFIKERPVLPTYRIPDTHLDLIRRAHEHTKATSPYLRHDPKDVSMDPAIFISEEGANAFKNRMLNKRKLHRHSLSVRPAMRRGEIQGYHVCLCGMTLTNNQVEETL